MVVAVCSTLRRPGSQTGAHPVGGTMIDDALPPSSEGPAGAVVPETATASASALTAAPASALTAAPASAPVARIAAVPHQDCPECGLPVPVDPRFSVWCAACGWNADPTPPEPPRGRMRARGKAAATRQGERLHAELLAHAAQGVTAPGLDGRGVAAYVLAATVHLTTLALTAGGLLLVVFGWGVFLQVALGAVMLLVAFGLRPRVGRLPEHAVTVDRAAAPRLYALLDRVAAETGTRTVDVVVLSPAFNAGVSEYGLRGRRLLTLGLPLWRVLGPQERVAVLGHEFGHYANGDTRRTFVVGGALRTLVVWYDFLRPGPSRSRGPLDAVARAFLSLLRGVVRLVLWLLDRLTLHTSRRAEYRADVLAARVASSEAAERAFDSLLIADSLGTELRRQAVLAHTGNRGATARAVADGLWQRLGDHGRSVTANERERLRRVSALRGHSASDTHPPIHLRCALIAAGVRFPAAVTLDDAEAATIDAELAVPAARLAATTLRDIHL